ncbi:tRNA(Ile)-lysidine synthetase [Candidatus Omnitrophus magneticus]|uniref:tRNA(Ile)-lysidine synthase n=1 Tax=Candidatus Omnitrophus magneticus TaxID=1609969 RepID=A0A0F0CQ15_9BACT|nr:tRNA(Ile)-lysidine synthetase [Candidatus Omnitrophus magneticus]
MMIGTFIKKTRDTIKHYGMISSGDRILVAVSGGSDSVALLNVLVMLKDEFKIFLNVANIDHSLRGDESRKDSDFVKNLAEKFLIPFEHKKINLASFKKTKKSFEEYAREARYEFFKKAASKLGCNIIATAHTINDQAETILMRIIKGTSAKGITGIPPIRYEDDFKIIRPFIDIEKKEIKEYLARISCPFREDSSNCDTKYFRNAVRLEILPFLEKYNPKITRAISNLSDNLRDDLTFIESAKKNAIKHFLLSSGIVKHEGGFGINIKYFILVLLSFVGRFL